MTIREFAKHCGLSASTVSRYYNDPSLVGEQAVEIIEAAIAHTGYKPKLPAKDREKNKDRTICLILPEWRHIFFTDMLQYLEKYAELSGARLVSFACNLETPEDGIRFIKKINPIGVVLLDEIQEDPFVMKLVENGIPTVMCAQTALMKGIPSIRIDDMAAAYDGVQYLIGRNHKKIGILANKPHSVSSGFQRVMAYEQCLSDNNLKKNEDYIIYAGNTFHDGYNGMKTMLNCQDRVTAVFACSDSMASGAVMAIIDKGLRVPEDISVLSLDGCSLTKEVRPLLTSVSQPLEEIAKHSVDTLIKGKNVSIILPHYIEERESCGSI